MKKFAANPILLKAKPHAQPVYFHTKGYETGRYANNMRCSWILMGTTSRKRIVLTVQDSSIDDALFSQCDDYCSVHDGKFHFFILFYDQKKNVVQKFCPSLCSISVNT